MQSTQIYLPLYLNSDLARNILWRSRLESKSVCSVIKDIVSDYFKEHPSTVGNVNVELTKYQNIDIDLRRAIGTKMAYLRQANYLSQRALGELLGMDQKAISNMENGKRKIDIIELIALAQVLSTEISYFFD